jgi:hypothetical protein
VGVWGCANAPRHSTLSADFRSGVEQSAPGFIIIAGTLMASIGQRVIALDLTGTTGVIVWSLVLIGFIIAGLAVALQVKKRITHVEPSSASPGGFTLSDLRQMVKEGKLTPEEFEKAKLKIVAAAKRATERSGNQPPGGGESGRNI